MINAQKKYKSIRRFITVFILPTFLLYCAFAIFPIFKGLNYSFYKWSGYSEVMTYVGLDNYARLLQDETMYKALTNELIYVLLKEVGIIAIALISALFLARSYITRREKNFFRALFFFPNMLSVILIGFVWSFIYHPSIGILNSGLEMIGLGNMAKAWLGETNTVVPAISVIAIWAGVGFFVLYFLAGIKGINEELFDASKVDGAGAMRQFFCIILPQLKEHIKFAAMYILFTTMAGHYVLIQVLTMGGPADASHNMGSYMWESAFKLQNVGYSCALGGVMLVLTIVLTTLYLKFMGEGREE